MLKRRWQVLAGGVLMLALGWNAMAQDTDLEGLMFQMALQEGLEEEAPDFTLHNLQGRTVRLKDFRGKVVLLSFFNTW